MNRRQHRGQYARATVQGLCLALLLVLCPMVSIGADKSRDKDTTEKQANKKEESRTVWSRVAYYVPSRVADFLDMFRLNVGFGLGLGVNVRPTKGLQAGLGAYDSVRIGLRGRRTPFWHEWSLEGGFDGMYYELGDTERGFFEVGGTVHLLLIGLDVGFDIEEALDFAYGLFLGDPADDDLR